MLLANLLQCECDLMDYLLPRLPAYQAVWCQTQDGVTQIVDVVALYAATEELSVTNAEH